MSLAAVYETDRKVAEVTSEMTHVGIGFDLARAQRFADMLRQGESDAAAKAEAAINRPLKRTKGGGISTLDLEKAFFEDLGVPMLYLSALTGKPSLSAVALQAYAATQNKRLKALALAELERRRARKIRSTYIDGIVLGGDGRVHPTWKGTGTVSGRWAVAGPNLANLVRAAIDPCRAEGGIRSLYIPAPGCAFIYYDKSQIEFRIAAYASGDQAMIAACEAGDVHSANAETLFAPAFSRAEYKALKALDGKDGRASRDAAQQVRYVALDNLRTLAKSSVFAVCYLAEAPTVHERIVSSGVDVKLRQVEAMLTALRTKCRAYYRWQADRLLQCIRDGYTTTPMLGRRRWLGHEPAPTECANFPIQGGAADVMNAEIPDLHRALKGLTHRARIVAHVYDSVLIEIPERHVEAGCSIVRDITSRPVTISTSGEPLTCTLPIDLDVCERWH